VVSAGTPTIATFESFLVLTSPGNYDFKVDVDADALSSVQLWINGRKVKECKCFTSCTSLEHLAAGTHHISLLFIGNGVSDSVHVSYQGPDTANSMVAIPVSAYGAGVKCCPPPGVTLAELPSATSQSLIELYPLHPILREGLLKERASEVGTSAQKRMVHRHE